MGIGNFFKTSKFPGWKDIGKTLIEKKECLVPDTGTRLWIGGVGNWIFEEEYEKGVDIKKLSFKKEEFFHESNSFFHDELRSKISKEEGILDYQKSLLASLVSDFN